MVSVGGTKSSYPDFCSSFSSNPSCSWPYSVLYNLNSDAWPGTALFCSIGLSSDWTALNCFILVSGERMNCFTFCWFYECGAYGVIIYFRLGEILGEFSSSNSCNCFLALFAALVGVSSLVFGAFFWTPITSGFEATSSPDDGDGWYSRFSPLNILALPRSVTLSWDLVGVLIVLLTTGVEWVSDFLSSCPNYVTIADLVDVLGEFIKKFRDLSSKNLEDYSDGDWIGVYRQL